ncbi:MAG: nicotinate (nicotinamide) nucleotide adenylyltransferase [Acidobacteriota bacterium]
MRIGLYGGSFDPIHRGHVEPVRAAATALELDRVLYLPTAQPPHKRGRRLAPAWRRFAMVELALLDEPDFEVDPFEMTADVAYTIETVEHFERQFPEGEFFLIVGADSFIALETWHRGAELAARVQLAVLVRRGSTLDVRSLAEPQRLALGRGRVHRIEPAPHPASSTEIRRRLAVGEPPPEGWLEPAVLNYVQKYGLYATSETDEDAGRGPSQGSSPQ